MPSALVNRPRFAPPEEQIDALVLVIDADALVRRALAQVLSDRGARVIEATCGSEGLALAAARRPDLVILDLVLPDMTGEALCVELRSWSEAAILVLSSPQSEADGARLLDIGADDCLTKPFGSLELVARVRAHLRRIPVSRDNRPTVVRAGDVEIDLHQRGAFKAGERIHLTPLEWALLRTLASQGGRTLTHRQLFDSVWARSHGNASQYLRVFVTALRKKIEKDPSRPRLIVTEPGVGYRFEVPRAAPIR